MVVEFAVEKVSGAMRFLSSGIWKSEDFLVKD